MAESNDESFTYNGRIEALRIARKDEKAFWGGPLDGSFDFTAVDDDDELDWWQKGSTLVHMYERDIIGKMSYKGTRINTNENNDHQADGS